MCGICGRLDFGPGADGSRTVLAMRDEMAHRGPDDSGIFQDSGRGVSVCLGHRRLSILDLSAAGSQPMTGGESGVAVVHNGEVYNFGELRRELESLGYAFKSTSDTEVVVHSIAQWGPDAVKKFRGMFAFAAWDGRNSRLILARDRLGKKPLFYYASDRFVSFASSLGSLMQDPDVPREIDPESLDLYLTYQYVPAPRTIFKGVKKLPPAHVMVIDRNGARTERYWRVDFSRKIDVSEGEAGQLILDKLRDAVRLRLVSDVPLGAFLSGGIDSGIVVALMAAHAGTVKTFSIGFEDEVYNELPDARKVAEKYYTDHHEFIVRPDAAGVLPMLVKHFGEPFSDSSAIPTFYVARETRTKVTVALNGDGGDESFAGYDRYLAQRIASRLHGLPRPIRAALAGLGSRLPEPQTIRHPLRRAKRFLEAVSESEGARYLRWICHFHPEMRPALYRRDFLDTLAGLDPARYLYDVMARAGGPSPVDRLQETDILTYLPEDLLVKADVATMAVSLEARSPFLDHELVELAASLPAKYKLRNLSTKRLLKKSFAGLLPPGHTARPKRGFGVPISRWLREELGDQAHDLIFSPDSLGRTFFRMEAVSKLFHEHQAGERDHGYRLYSLLVLELWNREVARGR